MQETLSASEAVIAQQNRYRECAKRKLRTDKLDSEKAVAKVLASRQSEKLDLTARVADEVQLIDPDVYKILEAADAMDYAASFEYHRITSDMLMSFTDADLIQIGVYALGVRKSILRVLEEYIAARSTEFEEDEQLQPQLPQPSAPPLPPILARFESECCVCQERG
ncbi:unnamed protein product, partial [Dibothriocephalus latus]